MLRSLVDRECVLRFGNCVDGLLLVDIDEAALTAPDAGVTVIATNVSTLCILEFDLLSGLAAFGESSALIDPSRPGPADDEV